LKRTFALAPGVGLMVEASGLAARHFVAEYGRSPDSRSPDSSVAPAMRLRVGPAARLADSKHGTHTARTFVGGHRLARWRVSMRLDADATSVSCALQVIGPLGLPLVQSMVIEPLLSITTPAAGRVLLPGALVEASDGPVLVLGLSGTGKSTLALRAAAANRLLAADDQILVASDGACAGLSRRLRVYGDLPRVVPEAHALLPAATRRQVALAGVVTRLSGGRVSPPVTVSPAALDTHASPPGRDMRPVRALFLDAGRSRARIGAAELVAGALGLLAEQRARLIAAGVSPPTVTLERETMILETALGHLEAERVDLRRTADPIGALERPVGA